MTLVKRMFPLHTLPLRAIRNLIRNTGQVVYCCVVSLPCFRFVRATQHSAVPRTLTMYFCQRLLGINGKAYWPVHFTSKVNQPQNIILGVDSCPGYEPGCYIQGLGKVVIGDYTAIAQNVGIISANHVPEDSSQHDKSESVEIGSYCWIGMNAVILPGVRLGDFSVVGAGSVVTKSFEEGYCIIAGNPARIIRRLNPDMCMRKRNVSGHPEYVGYLLAAEFSEFRKRKLRV